MVNLMGKIASSFIGVDLGHKAWQACRIKADCVPEYLGGLMTPQGIRKLVKWLKEGEGLAIETGTASFWFKKTVQMIQPCEVLILNALELKFISGSLKKNDKNDAFKIAQFVAAYDRKLLPLVEAPAEEMELMRKTVSDRRYIVRNIVQIRNRFYGLCIQAGYNQVKRKDLRTASNMTLALAKLGGVWQNSAKRLIVSMEHFEAQLADVNKECEEILKQHMQTSEIIMSMPGIGPVTALSILAYTNNFKTFSSPAAAGCYFGLVPRMDQSGSIEKKGRIIKRANRYLRGLMVQSAWALLRSKQECSIKEFHKRLAPRIGTGKAIIATARKMTEILYSMCQKQELFRAA